jgi:hypothetical protein
MAPADLRDRLRVRPFQPFRIVTSDGVTYDVRHPDLVLVTTGAAVVGFPDPSVPGIAGRYDILSLNQIVRLEQILPQAAPS